MSVECCGVTYEAPLQPPAICPNCNRPWGERSRPVEHRESGGMTTEHGHIVWCSCGVGSPPKPTVPEARASIAAHIANPSELPR